MQGRFDSCPSLCYEAQDNETKSVENQTHIPNTGHWSTSRCYSPKGILAIQLDVGNNAKRLGNLRIGRANRAKWLVIDQNRMLPVTELDTIRVCGKILVLH